jgi:holliday junction DNA helicase RuvA
LIIFLRGIVVSLGRGFVDLDVQNVGYRVLVTDIVAASLVRQETAFLYTYQHVREDANLLFGFADESSRSLFELLLSVSGIGPKSALQVVGATTAVAFAESVTAEDINTLCLLPGIGKKTAQRLLVELKDKVGEIWISGQASPRSEASISRVATIDSFERDVSEALTALGYAERQAIDAVKTVRATENPETVEEALRLALQLLYSERSVRRG